MHHFSNSIQFCISFAHYQTKLSVCVVSIAHGIVHSHGYGNGRIFITQWSRTSRNLCPIIPDTRCRKYVCVFICLTAASYVCQNASSTRFYRATHQIIVCVAHNSNSCFHICTWFYAWELMNLMYHHHFNESTDIYKVLIIGLYLSVVVYICTLLTANNSLRQLNIIACCGMILNLC